MKASSVEAFTQLVSDIEAQPGYRRPAAFGLGLATFAIKELSNPSQMDDTSVALDTWFPAPNLDENFGTAAILARAVGHTSGSASYRLNASQLDDALGAFAAFEHDGKQHPNVVALRQIRDTIRRFDKDVAHYTVGECTLDKVLPQSAVVTFIGELSDGPTDAHDAYLRLHLLSSRKAAPHGLSLDGVFGKLANVVWTNVGPFAVERFEQARGLLRSQGVRVEVHSIDKFPRMSDYVVPGGVRVADADRARLGAHLGEGTTVMHEGFVNFNAGTLGSSMVEGRISAGVTVDNGSDVGGGASIMGTLSGGGNTVNTVGKDCLLGANAGCGIPLGDGCTIEAGLYVTAGTKVKRADGSVIKARELAGQDNLLFRRNSLTGGVEVLEKKNEVVLNEELHKN